MAEEVIKKESKMSNLQKSLTRFFKDVKSELKKVIWPNRQQLTNNTLTVLLACLVVGIIIWLADFGLLNLAGLVFKAR
ncbi:preprotein translocase subunit SecE [Pseudobacteroides cellulosolvens]|uniref:Protein translocase subunit SecE n=1 Tax=Pseudobacteroides cellulosolvens ATCC 35603 = DSM 2933 TaxID=398512 RepID=A0A0L6JTJ2_9FIRM|nr:preprotein translocase subunit SecE [Pseudobacteroides cellulosolvens]KNY29138.1 preprotein translocase, SecE subunit [Pseudobacteroides cellulosolvens ATCC 35603 = DSM 2933]